MRESPRATMLVAAMIVAAGLAGWPAKSRSASELPLPAGIPGVVELVAVGPAAQGMNRDCSATGFLVNAEGTILTAAHAVDEARQCLAGSPAAKILARRSTPDPNVAEAVSCDVVAVDETHDLAVLKAQRPLQPVAESNFLLLSPQAADPGTAVAVSGHPTFAWQPRVQIGQVVRRERLPLFGENRERSDVLVLNIELHKGNSGSPVVRLADGAVVGIVERKDALRPAWSVAVEVRYAIELLDGAGVRWHSSSK